MNQEKGVISFIFSYLDALYYFKDENVNDHSKRVILRYFFILIDDLLKVVGKTKNKLYKSRKISLSEKCAIEGAIKQLSTTYNGAYDVIRDKISAHQQELSITDINLWWAEIDFTTIETLYSESHSIRNGLKSGLNGGISVLRHYSKMKINSKKLMPSNNIDFFVSSDRLGLAKPNTIAMVPLCPSQVKAQTILSILDLIENDCALTLQCEGYKTDYEEKLFDIAWLLIVCDTVSLIDNLYEDNVHDKSLISYWNDLAIKGAVFLENANAMRNTVFEGKLRKIRNTIAAHKDSAETIKVTYKLFLDLDLSALHSYVIAHGNIFRSACRLDIRTQQFLVLNEKINDGNIVELAHKTDKPFDK
jgi:hypothetical protein